MRRKIIMSKILEIKGYLVKYYGKYSKYVDKAWQFLLAFLTFTYISEHIGFSNIISNPIMTVILSIICMLLPLPLTVVMATVVILFQIMNVSLGMALVALALFIVFYALYFRYAPDKVYLLVIIPITFMLEIPVVVPIILGLIGGPVYILPISAGTMVHYLVQYVEKNATFLQSAEQTKLLEQGILYAQRFLSNPEMWCIIIAFAVTLLLVYGVRKLSVDYSWEIAMIAGVLGNINVMAYGYIIMEIKISYLALVLGSIVSIIAAMIVKLFVFSVAYTRTEYLQFEDDEYYYYVKAVPKVSVAIPEKTVKRINERQKTGVIDAEQIKKLEKSQKETEDKLAKQKEEDSEIQRIIEQELSQEK